MRNFDGHQEIRRILWLTGPEAGFSGRSSRKISNRLNRLRPVEKSAFSLKINDLRENPRGCRPASTRLCPASSRSCPSFTRQVSSFFPLGGLRLSTGPVPPAERRASCLRAGVRHLTGGARPHRMASVRPLTAVRSARDGVGFVQVSRFYPEASRRQRGSVRDLTADAGHTGVVEVSRHLGHERASNRNRHIIGACPTPCLPPCLPLRRTRRPGPASCASRTR